LTAPHRKIPESYDTLHRASEKHGSSLRGQWAGYSKRKGGENDVYTSTLSPICRTKS